MFHETNALGKRHRDEENSPADRPLQSVFKRLKVQDDRDRSHLSDSVIDNGGSVAFGYADPSANARHVQHMAPSSTSSSAFPVPAAPVSFDADHNRYNPQQQQRQHGLMMAKSTSDPPRPAATSFGTHQQPDYNQVLAVAASRSISSEYQDMNSVLGQLHLMRQRHAQFHNRAASVEQEMQVQQQLQEQERQRQQKIQAHQQQQQQNLRAEQQQKALEQHQRQQQQQQQQQIQVQQQLQAQRDHEQKIQQARSQNEHQEQERQRLAQQQHNLRRQQYYEEQQRRFQFQQRQEEEKQRQDDQGSTQNVRGPQNKPTPARRNQKKVSLRVSSNIY